MLENTMHPWNTITQYHLKFLYFNFYIWLNLLMCPICRKLRIELITFFPDALYNFKNTSNTENSPVRNCKWQHYSIDKGDVCNTLKNPTIRLHNKGIRLIHRLCSISFQEFSPFPNIIIWLPSSTLPPPKKNLIYGLKYILLFETSAAICSKKFQIKI